MGKIEGVRTCLGKCLCSHGEGRNLKIEVLVIGRIFELGVLALGCHLR